MRSVYYIVGTYIYTHGSCNGKALSWNAGQLRFGGRPHLRHLVRCCGLLHHLWPSPQVVKRWDQVKWSSNELLLSVLSCVVRLRCVSYLLQVCKFQSSSRWREASQAAYTWNMQALQCKCASWTTGELDRRQLQQQIGFERFSSGRKNLWWDWMNALGLVPFYFWYFFPQQTGFLA